MLLWFRAFVALHIAAGLIGLVAFWVPIIGAKGGAAHRTWGRVFTYAMLATGTAAIGISLCTLADPLGCHPQLAGHVDPRLGRFDAPLVRGIFGWMMLYLAVLTINLAWYGRLCVLNQRHHARNLSPANLGLQLALLGLAANCAWQGVVLGQPLLIGMSVIGFATVATNAAFLATKAPAPGRWLLEHIKALVGAGISVYTAFFAFGAVRLVPALALNPFLWAVPLTVGLTLIVYHQRLVRRRFAAARRPATA
jgi:hypothetical protein